MVAHGCVICSKNLPSECIQKMVILLRMRLSSTPGRSGQGHTLPPCSTCLPRPGITVRYCNISFTSRTWTAKPCQTIAFRPIASCIYTLYMCRCCFFTSQSSQKMVIYGCSSCSSHFNGPKPAEASVCANPKGKSLLPLGWNAAYAGWSPNNTAEGLKLSPPNENPP